MGQGCISRSNLEIDTPSTKNGHSRSGSMGSNPEPIRPMTEEDKIICNQLDRRWSPVPPEMFVKLIVSVKPVLQDRLAEARSRLPKDSTSLSSPTSAKQASPKHVRARRGNARSHIGAQEEADGQRLLEKRLKWGGFEMKIMKGDGNCQFRSASFNLYGHEQHHAYVRKCVIKHMRAKPDEFGVFFVSSEFEEYLRDMSVPGTWGDELTIRAIADAFQCVIHIITTTKENFYLRYDPIDDNGEKNASPRRHLFFTYISPIHYNSFILDHTAQ
eukprot:Selendium_serpulae@DN5937_c0_g1_i3.p2